VSLPPGILFVIGSFMVAESPRWLLRRGKKEAAYAALLRSRTTEQADLELREMLEVTAAEKGKSSAGTNESLLRRKYVIPFVLACIILACNQATGINSIIAYNTNILLQSGLSDVAAHWGYVVFTIINFAVTFGGVVLVDRKGRKFLLGIGTAGIVVSLICTGILFLGTERQRVDSRNIVQAMVTPDQTLSLVYNEELAATLMNAAGVVNADPNRPTSLVLIYSYGDFRAASQVVRSDDRAAKPIDITRESCVPANKVVGFFSNPFGNLDASRTAPLRIENALITPVPLPRNGWMVAITLFVFMAFYAIGPGVCVWLALSELMPTRIRSNGMSIALVLNQAVSTTIAAIFLPTVGRYGYSMMFFGFAACTVLYFVTAIWFLPETKGKTLEEIEAYFEGATPGK
jgi:SP family myo-inositol transporter-like MFS transporter 13